MASLMPDVGNVRPDTVGAGKLYQAAMEGFQRSLNAPMERIERLQAKQLAEEARAEELRRYNQEFGLKQAAANREQAKYDKEVNTDKALIDFQNHIASASAGGVMSNQQGAQLGDEYNRLIKTVGEEEAARIINEKAQKFGAEDSKRAESDPYYRAELIKGVALPSGNIDPKSLIDLRNSQIIRNETLGQRKEDLEIRKQERKEDLEIRKQERAEDLWLKKQELEIRKAEKNERDREKLEAKKAVAELVGLSMNEDQNKSSSGAYYNVNEVKTGKKILKDGMSIPEDKDSKELSEMKALADKIDSLASKNKINYGNRDEAFKAYMEENPEAANSNAAIKGIDRSLKGASSLASLALKKIFLPSEGLGQAFDKSKQIFMSDVEREEYNKKLDEAKAKEVQESLKSNNKDNKAKSENISFEEYWGLKKQQQDIDNAEIGKLQKQLENKGLEYYDNLTKKYGVDEVKSVPKEMTPHEARIYATKNTVQALIAKGVSEENALKLGAEEGEKAFKFQTNYINNVNEDAKESAKNRYAEVKEEKKSIEKKIETLENRKFEIGKNKEGKIVYNGQTVKLSEVQDDLDNEISRLKKELANIK